MLYLCSLIMLLCSGQFPAVSQDASMYSAPEARDKNYPGLTVSRGNVFYQAVFRFDLSNLPEKPVKDAAVMLFHKKQYHNSPMRILAKAVNVPWDEKYVCWNKRTKDEVWGKGAFGSDVVAKFDISKDYGRGWIVLQSNTLTRLVNQWILGKKPNYELILSPAFKLARGPSMKFFTGKDENDTDHHPKLILSYDKPINLQDYGYISDAELKRRKELQKKEESLYLNRLQQRWGGREIVIWPMGPWEKLKWNQFPTIKPVNLQCTLLRHEYQELSFAVTNVQTKPVRLDVQLNGSSNALEAIVLRSSYWIEAKSLSSLRGEDAPVLIDDVLPRLEKDRYLTLKPGETRRLWLTVNSANLDKGNYQCTLQIKSESGKTSENVPLKIKILSINLERDPELHVFTYAYLNRRSTAKHYELAVNDLKAHYQNTYVVDFYPGPELNNAGKITNVGNFEGMTKWLNLIKDAKKILFFWCWDCGNSRPTFGGKVEWMSPAWKNTLKVWINAWYRYLEKQGFDYDRIVMYPFDETYDNPILGRTEYEALGEISRELDSIDSRIQVFADPVSFGKDDLAHHQKLVNGIDIWSVSVGLLQKGDHTGWPHSYTEKEKAAMRNFFNREKQSGKTVWAYQCGGPMKTLDVNSYYRKFSWLCWYNDITGLGIWSYNNIRGPSGWDDFDAKSGSDFTMIYELRDAPEDIPRDPEEILIPSRRWQVWRAAIQDYLLLQQVRRKCPERKDDIRRIVTDVLGEPENPQRYTQAREKLLYLLVNRSD